MQKYHKRENFKVNKVNLQEITGPREELKEYLGQVLECEVFVTNSLGYMGEKRLLTEIRIPNTNYYIKHLWVKEYNLPINEVEHGYRKIKLKVVEYSDKINGYIKYGVQIADKRLKKDEKIVIPKWKQEMIEDQEFKKEVLPEVKPNVKQPFKKIRRVK